MIDDEGNEYTRWKLAMSRRINRGVSRGVRADELQPGDQLRDFGGAIVDHVEDMDNPDTVMIRFRGRFGYTETRAAIVEVRVR